ncbi:MAG: hypothetical protein PF589_02550 [Gammaproteobacteria bacterium]|jgi:hypothetical protein|nr:hypothetical protein [Gammaproteobacteria bacterium]
MPAALLLLFSSSSFAWWSNNNGWNNWAEKVLGDNDRHGPYGYSGYDGWGW